MTNGQSSSLASLVWCCRAPCGGYCESAGVEGRRFASAMVDGRTSREFSHPTTNVDEESSGRWLQSADRRFGYKLTSVGVHPGSAYLTTEERSCQAQWILESMWPKTPCRLRATFCVSKPSCIPMFHPRRCNARSINCCADVRPWSTPRPACS